MAGGCCMDESIVLCASEQEYIRGGISVGVRSDGRTPHDYLPVIRAELNPIQQTAASFRLAIGGTDCLVSVKGDIVEPLPSTPDQGMISCAVDCSSAILDGGREINGRLSTLLDAIFAPSFPLQKLALKRGQYCWKLFVDVLVMEADGSVLDVAALATRSALLALRLPKVSFTQCGESCEVSLLDAVDPLLRIDKSELPLLTSWALSPPPTAAATQPPNNQSQPQKHQWIVNPTWHEEYCCDKILIVAKLADSSIVFCRKIGGAGALDAVTLETLMAMPMLPSLQAIIEHLDNLHQSNP